MDTLHDAFGYSQSGISPLKPSLTAFPPEYPGLTVKDPADSPLAQAPQLGQLADRVVPLEGSTSWRGRTI
jgi:hypothetical protein